LDAPLGRRGGMCGNKEDSEEKKDARSEPDSSRRDVACYVSTLNLSMSEGLRYSTHLLKISDPFVPPKPNELESATLTAALRATFGT
jgi:hypothetical protein